MTTKIPVRANYDVNGNPIGLAEFQSGETIDPVYVLVPKTYIDGLQLQYVSAAAITIGSGSAYIESKGSVLIVDTAISKTGLSLATNTWYYIYLYDNSGTPDVEIVATSPATPYASSARSKTSDTTRRMLGAIRTDSSGNIKPFRHDISTNRIQWTVADTNTGAGYRVLQGGVYTTTATSLDLSLAAAPIITSECLIGITLGLSTGTAFVDLEFTLQNSTGTTYGNRNAELGAAFSHGQYPATTLWTGVLETTPSIYYFSTTSSSPNAEYFLDVFAYGFSR